MSISSDLGETQDAEVTPAMLVAGRRELDSGTAQNIVDGWVNPEDVVSAVYRAMCGARSIATSESNPSRRMCAPMLDAPRTCEACHADFPALSADDRSYIDMLKVSYHKAAAIKAAGGPFFWTNLFNPTTAESERHKRLMPIAYAEAIDDEGNELCQACADQVAREDAAA